LPNILTKLPGYLTFYYVKVSDTELVTFSIFERREQLDEAARAVLDWVPKHLGALLVSGPEIINGEVILHDSSKKSFPGQMAA
jgi:hypothetical protein